MFLQEGSPTVKLRKMKLILPITILLVFVSTFPVNSDEGRNCYPITAKDLIREGAPHFDQYPAKAEQIRHPAEVNLKSNPMARRYRTVLREEAARGANFAT